ncbi:MAG: 30S ribosomal protein S9 [Candidatus Kapaibacterium sp.]|jgi:small subunit ribosomal protein S9|nr:30S ribosomal protein S9 [Ignavibacteria bacterium]MBN8572444.1 30S ribosomal protein S9 [Candidatus Kapabacteria bacterium]HRE56656.1 30S ribosomal protein S9 [Candidatus Kapabacteria bacterium]HRK59038.1 30S ribosomal protein S9 [Candidatus Kapabacteria bacterium]
MNVMTATGRRKTAIAQVRLTPGAGKVTVNSLPIEEYFPIALSRLEALRPLTVAKLEGSFDISIKVNGGGKNGQAGAVRLGISRALVEYNETLRPALHSAGFMTRDPRMVERKKYGQKKARKRFQFSKR